MMVEVMIGAILLVALFLVEWMFWTRGQVGARRPLAHAHRVGSDKKSGRGPGKDREE